MKLLVIYAALPATNCKSTPDVPTLWPSYFMADNGPPRAIPPRILRLALRPRRLELCPCLTKPKWPFFVKKPALTRRFSFLAVMCFLLETMRPCLFIINADLVRPPLVFFAVPCQTWARDPILTSCVIIR